MLSLPAFQDECMLWAEKTFGETINNDVNERNQRFLEESLELVQSTGMTVDQAHVMVDYVFNRPVGETFQEIGGTIITLALLCSVKGYDISYAGAMEIHRCWDNMEKIKAKQAQKPKFLS